MIHPRRSQRLRSRLLVASLAVALTVVLALVAVGGWVAVHDYRAHASAFLAILRSGTTLERERLLEGEFIKLLLRALAVALAVGVPVALLVSRLVARRVLDPLERISNAAQRIAAGSYRERLPEQDTLELGQLAHEFNLMAATLERVEAQRVELIATVGHELRTPLTGLLGYAEGLREGVFTPDEAGEAIRREVSRLRRVVNDLSEVSRAESGALSLQPETFDLGLLAAELSARYAPMVEDGGSTLTLTPTDAPMMVRADRDRVGQIALNLISNALRHAPGSPIRLELRSAEGMVSCCVIDRGSGIGAEHLPHIFERFYRATPTGADAPNGTGVGLTISSALARAMGGSLECDSTIGVGSRFTLVLPAVDGSLPARL